MNKIYKNKYWILILLIPFFKPICIQYYSKLNFLEETFIVYKVLVAGIVLLHSTFTFANGLKLSINKYILSVVIFEIWIVFVTLIKSNDIMRSLIDCVSIIIVCHIILNGISKNKKNFLYSFKTLLLFLNVCQLITTIIYPSGMPADLYTENEANALFFITLDNGTTGLSILGILLVILYYWEGEQHKNKHLLKRIIPELLICVCTAIGSGSTTAVLCSITFIAIYVCAGIKELRILESSVIWVFVYVVLLGMTLSGENTLIIRLINNLTGKIGFTGRNHLWTEALKLIRKSPIVGYGRQKQGYIKIWYGYFSSHNMILEMILQGGILAFLFWVRCLKKSLEASRYVLNMKLKRILVSSLFILLIGMMMEAFVHSIYFWSICSLIYAEGASVKFHRSQERDVKYI